jgi:Domain of unknown function (DUF4129)
MPRRLAWLFVTGLLLCSMSPESAGAVTGEEVADLARAAASGDVAALRTLRAVDTVNGRPVDLDSALAATGPELRARLEILARSPVPPPEGARSAARDILTERRFRTTDLPQPLRGPLEALADRLRDLGEPLGSLIDALPGEGSIEWILLALIVAAVSAFIALRLGRRRARLRTERSLAALHADRPDPRRLEAAAARAEAEGDLERALRFRFAAGLMHLDARRAIAFSPSLTTGDVARRLRSDDFDRVAAIFDEVVYGRRPATDSDVSETRAGWDRVIARSRSR